MCIRDRDAVLIRVSLANVCGSDLHFWRGDAPLRLPEDGWIFGHEMTGRVAKLGARVKTDSLGRPLGPSQFPHFHGAFAEYYYLRPRGAIFLVPDSFPDELVSPVNCALCQ